MRKSFSLVFFLFPITFMVQNGALTLSLKHKIFFFFLNYINRLVLKIFTKLVFFFVQVDIIHV